MIGKQTPEGAMLKTDSDIVRYFTEIAGVATLEGNAYGIGPYLRLSFATSDAAIREGCCPIVSACAATRLKRTLAMPTWHDLQSPKGFCRDRIRAA